MTVAAIRASCQPGMLPVAGVWTWLAGGGCLFQPGGSLSAGRRTAGRGRYLFQPRGSGRSAHSTAGAADAISRPPFLGKPDRERQLRRMWFMTTSSRLGPACVAQWTEIGSGACFGGGPLGAGSTVASGARGHHTEPPIGEPVKPPTGIRTRRDGAGGLGLRSVGRRIGSAGCRLAGADRLCGSARAVAEKPGLSFAGLLRQLRAEARLTQEELAEAAGLSTGSVSNLERGINRTAQKDTAVLLAGALGLAGSAGELFVAAARGKAPAADVLLAASAGTAPGPVGVAGSPYRGLKAFEEQDAGFFFGREAATAEVLDRMSRTLGGAGLLVVSGVSGAGKSSLLRAGVLPRLQAEGLLAVPGAAWWPRVVFTPTRAPLEELALRAGVLAGADAV